MGAAKRLMEAAWDAWDVLQTAEAEAAMLLEWEALCAEVDRKARRRKERDDDEE